MKRENFLLSKVKVSSTGGSVLVEYTDADNPNNEVVEKRSDVPHPDLFKSLQGLTTFVATSTHLDALKQLSGFIKGEKGKEFQGILAKSNDMQQHILDSIDVRSLTIKGEEESRAVIISSVLSCKGYATALNTPRIRLMGDVYGNEVALSESVDEVIEEVWQYLFNSKTSQTKMEFND